METDERSEMQKAFDKLNHAESPQKEEMIRAWMRKTLDEAVSIKARRPIETWIENTKHVLTEQNEEAKEFAANWQRELEEALAKIT
jgi:hypothetical protein